MLGALPKSAHPGAKKALAEIWNAEDKRRALDAVRAFEAAYGAKFGKAVAKITDDLEVLLAFYDFPAGALDPPAHDQPHLSVWIKLSVGALRPRPALEAASPDSERY